MNKNIKIIIIVGLLVVIGLLVFLFTKKDNSIKIPNDEPKIEEKKLSKEELKSMIEEFEVEFNSYPYNTSIKYNFIDKTKIIDIKNSNPVSVEYNRFDELFDYLYNNAFTKLEKGIHSNSSNNNSETGQQPNYEFRVSFETSNDVPSYVTDWHPYVNKINNKAYWVLTGYNFPSYFDDLLKVLEIDDSIFGENNNYNLHN